MPSKILFYGMLVLIVGTRFVMAHGDHSTPGMMPPAPHGGSLQEAEETEEHDHHHSTDQKHSEAPVFLEATYQGGEVRLYPLTLSTPGAAVFSPLSVGVIKSPQLSIEHPKMGKREKRTESISAKVEDKYLSAKFQAPKSGRFFVLFKGEIQGEERTARIQIESP